jgi:hypothetical protein
MEVLAVIGVGLSFYYFSQVVAGVMASVVLAVVLLLTELCYILG